jgi:hypothetical protein
VVLAVVVFAAVLVVAGRRDGTLGGGPSGLASGEPPPDPPSPVAAAWNFDEGAGHTAADAAGGMTGRPMRLHNGASWTAGQDDSALQLDGIGGFAATDGPVLDTADSYSVSAWVRLDQLPKAFVTAVSQDGAGISAFFLQYSDADGRFAFSAVLPDGRAVRALSLDRPVAGRWFHLVGVRDAGAGTLALWLDGARQGTGRYPPRKASAGALVVGRALFGGREVDFWPGAVDSVAAYGGILTGEQVADLYQAGR